MNVLLVGLGGMGRVHLANIKHLDGVTVCAAVGASAADKETAAALNLPYFASIDEAFAANLAIDVVDITTPTFLHATHIRQALAHNVDVICEKPLCLSSSEAEELYAEAEKRGLSLIVAQVLRFTKEYGVLQKLINEKTYGELLSGSFTRLSALPHWLKDGWLFDKEKSGLVPFDLHIHDLDMIVSLFGPMESHTVVSASSKDRSFEAYYRIEYTYPDFSLITEAGWLNASIPFTATWRMIFSDAVVINDGSTITAYPFQKDPVIHDTSYDVIVETGINVPPTGWYYEELKAIFACLKQSRPCTIVEKDGILTTLRILESL
ncbi:MAG: Gfo/Idh/MocA family oxidoreductase [Sphaerochaeta sp.]